MNKNIFFIALLCTVWLKGMHNECDGQSHSTQGTCIQYCDCTVRISPTPKTVLGYALEIIGDDDVDAQNPRWSDIANFVKNDVDGQTFIEQLKTLDDGARSYVYQTIGWSAEYSRWRKARCILAACIEKGNCSIADNFSSVRNNLAYRKNFLSLATWQNDTEAVTFALNKGARVDTRVYDPFHGYKAAPVLQSACSVDVAKILVAAGALEPFKADNELKDCLLKTAHVSYQGREPGLLEFYQQQFQQS